MRFIDCGIRYETWSKMRYRRRCCLQVLRLLLLTVMCDQRQLVSLVPLSLALQMLGVFLEYVLLPQGMEEGWMD